MKIAKNASAGTLESSDVLISVAPSDSELELTIESVVKNQYYDVIKKTILDVLKDNGVEQGIIKVDDHGALDCVLKARMETAIKRGGLK